MASPSSISLKGRIAVVTGATSEIGTAIAIALAEEGARLALTGRSPEKLQAVVEQVSRAGDRPIAEPLDLSDPSVIGPFFDRVEDRLGPVDILVHVAAWRKPDPFLEVDYADWQQTFRVSVDSAFLCGQAAARQMVPEAHGRILFIGSVSGVVYMHPFPAYTAAKGALHALTKALAVELAPHGITVNEIAPGPVDTAYLRANLSPGAVQQRVDRIPAGRLASPEDCARAVLHLASDDTGYITGQTIYVDGGFLSAGVVPPARKGGNP
jgi:NAD(P)-dependent dehydrogenase (short-subunit alcohol dehydrogenase family)